MRRKRYCSLPLNPKLRVTQWVYLQGTIIKSCCFNFMKIHVHCTYKYTLLLTKYFLCLYDKLSVVLTICEGVEYFLVCFFINFPLENISLAWKHLHCWGLVTKLCSCMFGTFSFWSGGGLYRAIPVSYKNLGLRVSSDWLPEFGKQGLQRIPTSYPSQLTIFGSTSSSAPSRTSLALKNRHTSTRLIRFSSKGRQCFCSF